MDDKILSFLKKRGKYQYRYKNKVSEQRDSSDVQSTVTASNGYFSRVLNR